MTICLKDRQTHHVQALPEYHRRIPVILILDLPTTKAMAMTTTATTLTHAQFIPQYPNKDLNPNPKSERPWNPVFNNS